jgi:putative sterol carrier protein
MRIFARLVDGASDAKLERRFGSRLMQRVIFTAMAARFNPKAANGFEGRIAYELARPATEASPLRWTIDVSGPRARASRGARDGAAVTLRLPLADFIRIGAGTIDPATPVLQGRASFQGDFGLVVRIPEMFRANAPRQARG